MSKGIFSKSVVLPESPCPLTLRFFSQTDIPLVSLPYSGNTVTTAIWRASSHKVSAPYAIVIRLRGTIISPPLNTAGASRFFILPFTTAVSEPASITTSFLSFSKVTVCVVSFIETVAPKLSPTVHTGIIVIPFSAYGATSQLTSSLLHKSATLSSSFLRYSESDFTNSAYCAAVINILPFFLK